MLSVAEMVTVPFYVSPTTTPSSPLPLSFSTTPRFLSPTKPPFHNHNNNTFFLLLPFSSRNEKNNTTPPAPETECPVPKEQQPINEYQSLSTSFPFSWASGDVVEYSSRLFVTGAAFALFVGLPVSWSGSVGAESEPLKRILCAASSGVFVVTLAVVRMYLGWAYVGNRLLSATVECTFSLSFY